MIKRIKQILVSASAILMLAGLGASANNVNVNARHRRTHRVYYHKKASYISGYWAVKRHHQVWGLTFLKSGVAFNPSGAAISNWSHPIYRYAGRNAFTIKPSRRSYNNTGRVRGERYYVKVRAHHHIEVWTNGQYIGTYHKVTHHYLFD